MPIAHLLESAQRLCAAVLRLEQPADRVMAEFFRGNRGLGSRDRALLADTAYAILRRKLLLENLAGDVDTLRRLVLLALPLPRATLLPALSAAEREWLRACDAQDPGALPEPCRHNLPSWLADALRRQLGAGFDAAAEALLEPAPLDLRVNILRHKRGQVESELRALGLDVAATPWSPWGLRLAGRPSLQQTALYRDGVVEVQDEGSQLLAMLLGARRNETVADFCAGAGGKTLALGAAMRGSGRIHAFDVSAARLDVLRKRVHRSGLRNVYPAVLAAAPDARLQRLYGKMDRVLVDAPCSGLGTLRRSPDLKWRQPQAAVAGFAVQQGQILARAARLLRPGGRLVYATCSLLEQENEAVAAAFGAAHPDFDSEPVAAFLTGLKVPDAAQLCSADGLYLRLWPHRHGTDGFFAAAWKRR